MNTDYTGMFQNFLNSELFKENIDNANKEETLNNDVEATFGIFFQNIAQIAEQEVNRRIDEEVNSVLEDFHSKDSSKSSRRLITARQQPDLRRINQRTRLMKSLAKKNINELTHPMQCTSKSNYNRILLAKAQKVSIDLIKHLTDEQVENGLMKHKEREAEIHAEQLILEESNGSNNRRQTEKGKNKRVYSKQAGKRKKRGNNRPRKTRRKNDRDVKTKSNTSSPSRRKPEIKKRKTSENNLSWADKIVLDLQITSKTIHSLEHPRVTKRWKGIKNLSDIRKFDSGRYAGMSETELKTQRARHYLPGIERIVSSKLSSEFYSFQTTDHGHGILCEMIYSEEVREQGVVYLGYGKQNKHLLIHRYFEPYDRNREGAMFEEEAFESAEEEKQEWKTNADYIFEVIKRDGSILMTFPNEEHSVRILPIQPDEVLKNLRT